MSKPQHTPGPWNVSVWDYNLATPPRKELNVQTETNLIATLAWDQGQDNPYTIENEQAQANARLIAAAPELLAACIAALDLLDTHQMGQSGTAPFLRNAIAKAKGE